MRTRSCAGTTPRRDTAARTSGRLVRVPSTAATTSPPSSSILSATTLRPCSTRQRDQTPEGGNRAALGIGRSPVSRRHPDGNTLATLSDARRRPACVMPTSVRSVSRVPACRDAHRCVLSRVVVPVVGGSSPSATLARSARPRRKARLAPMADALELLNSRLADCTALDSLANLLAWDQRTIMPPAGFVRRGAHMALLERLQHEQLVDPEVGRLIDELEPRLDSLDPDSWEAAAIRTARRDYRKAVQVPAELRGEMARAAAEAAPVWLEAKATSNFDLFLPVMERQVELRRRYIDCFESRDEPYDILLDDFEPEMKTAEVTRIFDDIKPELVDLVASPHGREVDDSSLTVD